VATFEIPRGSRPNPAVGEDGTLYFARQGSEEEPFGGAFAMAPDRSIAWRFETPGMRATMIAVGPGDRVLIGVDRELVDLTADGVELRRRELPGTIAAGPAIADDGAVYVATQGGSPDYAHALHVIAADGTTRFETRLNGLPLPDVPLAVARDGGALVATLATLTFFERDGSIRWERSLDSGPTDVGFDCSIDANGLVVVAHGDLFALRSEDGEEVWRIAPTSARPGTPCVDSVTIGGAGQIYAGECGGRLFEISGS
jgi:outer membrane protein assembly factor BamB